jgi:type I restriction enzyme S subunit
MGQSPPSSTYNTAGDGLPFFQGKADFGEIFPNTRVYCSQPARVAELGDILISVRAPVGPTNLARQRCCIGRGLSALRPSKHIDTEFLFYFLRFYEPQLAKLGLGSTFAAINRDDLEDTNILLPDLAEQKRIARLLEQADRLRRTRRYALELSDTFLPAAFVKLFGDPEANPRKWPETELGELCVQVLDCPHSTPTYTSVRTPHPCARSSDIQNGYLDFSNAKYVVPLEYEKRIARGNPVRGDVIYCREGARFGNAARVLDNTKLCLGQRMMLFRVDPIVTTSEFIWGFLTSQGGYRQADRALDGSASPHVNVGEIIAFRVPVPPLEMQRKFSVVTLRHEHLRARQREALRQADHLFQSLLHRAFAAKD